VSVILGIAPSTVVVLSVYIYISGKSPDFYAKLYYFYSDFQSDAVHQSGRKHWDQGASIGIRAQALGSGRKPCAPTFPIPSTRHILSFITNLDWFA
jgi:hypothetical protein